MRNQMISLGMALLFVACESSNKLNEGSAEEGDSNSSPTVSRPQNVTGTFLACHETVLPEEANGLDQMATIGCGFYDEADKKRKPVDEVAKSIDWGYETDQKAESVTIFKADSSQLYNYDVYYAFNVDQAELTSKLQGFVITFEKEEEDGTKSKYWNDVYMEAGKQVDSLNDLNGEGAESGMGSSL